MLLIAQKYLAQGTSDKADINQLLFLETLIGRVQILPYVHYM